MQSRGSKFAWLNVTNQILYFAHACMVWRLMAIYFYSTFAFKAQLYLIRENFVLIFKL